MKEKSGILERIRRCHPPLPLLPLPPSPPLFVPSGGKVAKAKGEGEKCILFHQEEKENDNC